MDTLTAVWKGKNGDVAISDMSEDHLQKAYNSAEYRYMKFENLTIQSSDTATLFYKKLAEIEEEAKKRGIALKSVTDKNPNKFGILRNRKRVVACGD